MGYERNDRGYNRDYRGDRDYGRDLGRGRYEDPNDRGFFDRAGDEVRSWFGDEEAERRRRMDERYDERYDQGRGTSRYANQSTGGYRGPDAYPRWSRSNRDDRGYAAGYAPNSAYYPGAGEDRQFGYDYNPNSTGYSDYNSFGYRYGSDDDRRQHDEEYRATYGRENWSRAGSNNDPHGYGQWRDRQIASFDRDYDEYRRENQSRFDSEFATWRDKRQTQRSSLTQAKEHQEVLGSDGQHVGTVDHVRGDHILLTKTDKDAGGHHHSIPSSWINTVDDKVHLSKTAEEAKRAWRDAEERGGLFDRDNGGDRGETARRTDLNRSFSGTY
jgi:hypothetical protein